jgi:hypothetical protein
MTVHKLRISFPGIASNAPHDLAKPNRMASEHGDYKDESDNLAYSARAGISAYRDHVARLGAKSYRHPHADRIIIRRTAVCVRLSNAKGQPPREARRHYDCRSMC